MKQIWKRSIAFAVALALMVAGLALPPRALAEEKQYGMTTAKGVRVRIEPSADAMYWFKVEEGYVCEITGQTTKSKVLWYEVNVVDPDPQAGGKVYSGYIHGDYFKPLTAKQTKKWLANPVQPYGSADPTAEPAPETAAPADDVAADALAEEADHAAEPETPVPETPAQELIVQGKTDAETAAPAATEAPAAVEEDFVVAAPAGVPADPAQDAAKDDGTPAGVGARGQITNSGVNFRKTENGYSMMKLDRGTVVELLTIPSVIDAEHWYKVRYNGLEGYIQAPFILVLSNGGQPDATASVSPSAYGYAQLKLSSANLRKTPAGEVGAQWEETGGLLVITGPSVLEKGYKWYPVNYGNTIYYVREDCITVLDAAGAAVPTPVAATPAPTAVPGTYGYVTTTKTNVNLRLKPAGEFIRAIPKKNTVLTCMGPSSTSKGYTWYYVQYENLRGYVRGDCVKVTDGSGNAPTATPAPTVTPAPTNADGTTATPAPTATAAPTAAPEAGYGSVRMTKAGVNLRKRPAGESIEQLKLGAVAKVTGPTLSTGKYIWYPVISPVTGKAGFVRGDCCEVIGSATPAPTAVPTDSTGATLAPTAVPTPTPNRYGYVKTTKSNVKLRKTPAGDSITMVPKNEILPMTGPTTTVKNYIWYPVQYRSASGYLRGDCVSPCDENGALMPEVTPTPDIKAVITTKDKVNLRTSPSKDARAKYNVGIGTVAVFTSVRTVGGSKWYQVVYKNENVWVLGSCVREMTADEYAAYVAEHPAETPQPEVVLGYVKTTKAGVNVRSQPAGTNILGRIGKGLILPYSTTPEVKGRYTWYRITADGMTGWISSQCLTLCDADGNPPATPTGTTSTTDPGNLSMVLYPAEKIDWYTGGIQTMWAKGSNYKIYDVKTGIVWWAHRWSGGYHVDAEPLTASDTARLCRIYGVSSASEIASKNLWQRRPSLVTIGNRTFACSLYGVPHNPAGDTIANNNFSGQLCIHFTNSHTHGSNKVDTYHAEAIQYAWEHAPNGHID